MAKWLRLALGVMLLVVATCGAARLIDHELDWGLVLLANPDARLPLLDTLVILVTDSSIPSVALLGVAWQAAYRFGRHPNGRKRAAKALRVFGVLAAAATLSAFFWAPVALPGAFLLLGPGLLFSFTAVATSIEDAGFTDLRRGNRTFWISVASALICLVSAETVVKRVVSRHKPLHRTHRAYRRGIRRLEDETCKYGRSYISGHAAIFFALVAPLAWRTRRRTVRACLLAWAVGVAYTRVYVAAHFVSCTIMGSLFGLSVGTAVTWLYGRAPSLPEASSKVQGQETVALTPALADDIGAGSPWPTYAPPFDVDDPAISSDR